MLALRASVRFNRARSAAILTFPCNPLNPCLIRVILVHLAASSNPNVGRLCDKGLTFHCPFEGFRHGGIEVGDKAFDPVLEMVLRGEIPASEKFPDQEREQDIDLVDPRAMLPRQSDGDSMCRSTP